MKFNELANRLRKANLKLQPDKCEFLRQEVCYLGHIIINEGLRPDPKKIVAVKEFPTPKTARNVKQFLGLAGYYRRFIPNFSKTARSLTELLKKDRDFRWNTDQENAFVRLRDMLCEEPILQYPDFTKPFVLTTDASATAIGGILSQGEIGKDLPIAYASRLLNSAEQNYSTIEKELLAIVYCVNHFRSYLFGHKFTLVTDHRPLVWLHSVQDPTSRLVRWRLKLAEYEYNIIYKAGKINANADALSRNPPEQKLLPLSTSGESDSSLFHYPFLSPSGPPDTRDHPPQTWTTQETTTQPRDENEFEEIGTEIIFSDEQITDSDSSSESGESERLFDAINEPYSRTEIRLVERRENITIRKDNLVFFTTQMGDPCDESSRALGNHGKMPAIRDVTLGRAKVTKEGNRYLIALTIKTRVSALTQMDSLKEALHSLLDVANELQLHSFSISKGDIDAIPWKTVRRYIEELFCDRPIRVVICTNQIKIPAPRDRPQLIRENHSTAIGGHKGITKTFNRIRYKYSWPRMKRDIETYIRNCKDCQLKKLVRVKTRQPMVLTDTPGAAFDKVSMDIMGPLPTTGTGNTYIPGVEV